MKDEHKQAEEDTSKILRELPTSRGGKIMKAQCMRCKTQREMKNEKKVTMKNGMKAMSGLCSKCGTKMFKIVGKEW